MPTLTLINYKRASLACAARLADTACPQSRPAGAGGLINNLLLITLTN